MWKETLPCKKREPQGTSPEWVYWAYFAVFLVVLVSVMFVLFEKSQRNTANREVMKLIEDAKGQLEKREWEQAICTLQEAVNTKHATDLDEANRLLATAKEAKAKRDADLVLFLASAKEAKARQDTALILRKAEEAISEKRFTEALRSLNAYLVSPLATERDRATLLQRAVRVATSDGEATRALTELADVEFDAVVAGTLPPCLEPPDVGSLKTLCAQSVQRNLEKAKGIRQERRLRAQRQAEFEEEDVYERDVAAIKQAVFADTIVPSSASFCSRFEILPKRNARGNKVYVGWYRSRGLNGVVGQDNIIAEVDASGTVLKLSIGDL
jgi:hypothetical protein